MEILKGNMTLMDTGPDPEIKRATAIMSWPPPPANRVALSVDGAFLAAHHTRAASMILRRHDGSVVFATYRFLFNCNDALEGEILI